MDASFDAYGTGWGDEGDKSFVTNQKKPEFDKVPIPVMVADLKRLAPGDEYYVIGAHKFSTIRIIGRVWQAREVDSQIEYEITDVEDTNRMNSFMVYHYGGVDSKDYSLKALSQDSIVHAIGRLRSFDNKLNMIAFQIHQVNEQGEVEAFPLEAKLAKIYFGVKNVPDHLINNSMDQFRGTLFTSEAPERLKLGNASGPAQSGQPAVPAQSRQQNISPPSAKRIQTNDHGRGLVGQKRKIFECLTAQHSEEGLNVTTIKQMLRSVTPRFELDLAELVDDGVIYQTMDDQHYAAV